MIITTTPNSQVSFRYEHCSYQMAGAPVASVPIGSIPLASDPEDELTKERWAIS